MKKRLKQHRISRIPAVETLDIFIYVTGLGVFILSIAFRDFWFKSYSLIFLSICIFTLPLLYNWKKIIIFVNRYNQRRGTCAAWFIQFSWIAFFFNMVAMSIYIFQVAHYLKNMMSASFYPEIAPPLSLLGGCHW